MKSGRHAVVIIQGLNDHPGKYDWIIKLANFEKDGLTPLVYRPKWHDGENFHKKLARASKYIDRLHKEFGKVSLIGCSAGASFAGNLFFQNKHVHKIVNNCGRLRVGAKKGFRGFSERTKISKAFAQSVLLFEKNEPKLTQSQRKRCMTVKPKFGDELVPANTVFVKGAKNISLFSVEHGITIGLTLMFSRKLREFLKHD